jgi:hypothetical protein
VKLGQCETCNLTVPELRARLETLAALTDNDRRDVDREIDETTPYFKWHWPRFLSRRE